MIPSHYLKLLHMASESSRHRGQETNRQAVVKEVKEEGGERKVRCIIGVRPDGSEWLTPWMSTQEQRSGQERSQSAIKPGQNGVIQGSFRQGTFSAQGESTSSSPQPKHAPKHNGPTSSVGKMYRSAVNGGEDDQQQGSSGGSGGSGGSSGGDQQQKKYPKEHFSVQYLSKEPEKLEQWKPQSGKATSTTTGNSGGGGQQASEQKQGDQKQQQQKEERAMQQVMHEKEGFTQVIGKGDDGVRMAAHPKGSKLRAGTDNFIVTEKDKKNYCKAKIDNFVHAVDGQNYVNKPWVIKDCPKDPVPNHDLSDEA